MSTHVAEPEEVVSSKMKSEPADKDLRQAFYPDSAFARLSRAIVTSGGAFILGWSFYREIGGVIGLILGLLIFYISERVQQD